MVILETLDDVKEKLCFIKDVLIIPILSSNNKHPENNSISVLSISTYDNQFYIIPINHNEGKNLNLSEIEKILSNKVIWTPDKKLLLSFFKNKSILDVNSLKYLTSNEILEKNNFLTPVHLKMDSMFSNFNVNRAIPIFKHIDFLKKYSDGCWNVINSTNLRIQTDAYKFLNDIAIPSLYLMEKSGLHVDEKLTIKKYGEDIKNFIKDGLIYSQYNLFTTTGRCSNKFGKINFAALNKKDGSRTIFDSRFENGLLVMADFESFHIRLIADLINYNFPTNISIHSFLGNQYFNKTELSEEEYEESKKISFKLLYGEERRDDIPDFFKKVYLFSDKLMKDLITTGTIQSPYFNRDIKIENIENPHPSKLLSYLIQLAETELNLSSLQKMQSLFENSQSKAILYTYDSVLFDFSLDDGKELLIEAIKVLSHDNKFPMRIYYGKDYHNLKKLTSSLLN